MTLQVRFVHLLKKELNLSSTTWQCYEEVAQYLLNQFAEYFGIDCVEESQRIPGKSGTNWAIDAKGVKDNETCFLIVECRRHARKIEQGYVGQVAFKIKDTGAQGGIIVSPLGFQKGAKKVAEYIDIVQVKLDPQSTTTEYMMEFFNRIFIGRSDTLDLTDRLTIRIQGPEEETKIFHW